MAQDLPKAVIFDLDGVITNTAKAHAAAWKAAFDDYLRLREERDGEPFHEFTHDGDYLPYVDGKPRYKGVRDFLGSRGIDIPEGSPDDPPGAETVCGIGNGKNAKFREALRKEGVEVFESTVSLIRELRLSGVRVGVASSSKNCLDILKNAKLDELFETRVDGLVSVELGLKGKPAGDIFTTAARNLDASPAESVVVEDAVSGVQAGRNSAFGLVLGIARADNAGELLANGADIVVFDMGEITLGQMRSWFRRRAPLLGDAWEKGAEREHPLGPGSDRIRLNPGLTRPARAAFESPKKTVLFLDYDGTLTPIVDRPELAKLSEERRGILRSLAGQLTTAIVSGRMREDVEGLVGIEGMFYAGSHGFDIKGPGTSMVHPEAEKAVPLVADVIARMKQALGGIEGLLVEEKRFSLAVHYRLVEESRHLPAIEREVEAAAEAHPELRLMRGRKVFELLPAIEWDKGRAVMWILDAMGLDFESCSVVYIGDDVTDENAFRAVRTRGCPILVSDKDRPTAADFRLASPAAVYRLFEAVAGRGGGRTP